MISQRKQTVLLLIFLACVGAGIALMIRFDRPDRPVAVPKPAENLDLGSQEPVGLPRLLAGPAGTVVRLVAGSCHQGGTPTLELSDDGGFRFRVIRVPQIDDGTGISGASPAISAIVAFAVQTRQQFVLWGADENCAIRSYSTKDAGASWRQGELPITTWWIDPESGVVSSPSGSAPVRCPGIRSLNGIDAQTAVATCTDGSVHISEDGATWESAANLDGATTAAVFTSATDGFSLRAERGCKSRLYATDDAGDTWTARGCVIENVAFPAIVAMPNRLMVTVKGPAWVSKDGGETWKPPPNPNADPEVLRDAPAPSPSAKADSDGSQNEDESEG